MLFDANRHVRDDFIVKYIKQIVATSNGFVEQVVSKQNRFIKSHQIVIMSEFIISCAKWNES